MLLSAADNLVRACANSKTKDVEQLLVNHRFTNGELAGAVASAAMGANIEILEMLWREGWNVRVCSAEVGLFGTMKSSAHEESVRWLLQHGANPNSRQDGDILPVTTAACYAPLSVLSLLLENGAILEGSSALSAAATSRQPDRIVRIDLLLKHGAYLNELAPRLPWHTYGLGGSRPVYRETALHAACRWGFEDSEEHLLSYSADFEVLDSGGKKALELKKQTLGLSYRGWSCALVSRSAKDRFAAMRRKESERGLENEGANEGV